MTQPHLQGSATPEATTTYMKSFPNLQPSALGSTGWQVSQAAFGGYRVDVTIEPHREALKKALRSGINLIDTSSNYTDGGSETLVGAVLDEMVREGEIVRQNVVVVSKVGYLQGQNFKLSQERKEEGRPFHDLVLYGQGLEHCIHPEFIEDQLTRTLQRLQMETLDAYLLHNPEYYLGWAKKINMPFQAARDEYYRRIELAFRHLESEVERGRIQCYGISSNTFPARANDYSFTSLERICAIAESISPNHHFKMIQLPMNLFETGGATEHNQSDGRTVLDLASEKNLGVLINRPLNALVGNGLLRLADVTDTREVPEAEVTQMIEDLLRREAVLKNELLPQTKLTLGQQEKALNKLAAGAMLQEHWRGFSNVEHWQETWAKFFVPSIQQGINLLPSDLSEWIDAYIEKANTALQTIHAYYQHQAADRSNQIKAKVVQADAEWGEAATLSQMAVRALRSTKGISTVLVGMRQDDYVEDVVQELAHPIEVRDRIASWQDLRDGRL